MLRGIPGVRFYLILKFFTGKVGAWAGCRIWVSVFSLGVGFRVQAFGQEDYKSFRILRFEASLTT